VGGYEDIRISEPVVLGRSMDGLVLDEAVCLGAAML
jgi:hypothetical protein